jgi:L-fuconolactonase
VATTSVPVDGYAHCGQEKFLPVEALEEVMRDASVGNAVLCQHLGQYDNSYIAAIVEARPTRFAGVALVDHRAPQWERAVADLVKAGFSGIRVTSDALVECPALADAVARSGLAHVHYAPAGIGPVVAPLRALAATHPLVPYVVSHLGNPSVVDGALDRGDELLGLADLPNVYVLLSGLSMLCPFPFTPLDRLIMAILEAFGPTRVMWGSNFPVGGDGTADYSRELELLRSGRRWGLDTRAVEAVTDGTARSLWFQ